VVWALPVRGQGRSGYEFADAETVEVSGYGGGHGVRLVTSVRFYGIPYLTKAPEEL